MDPIQVGCMVRRWSGSPFDNGLLVAEVEKIEPWQHLQTRVYLSGCMVIYTPEQLEVISSPSTPEVNLSDNPKDAIGTTKPGISNVPPLAIFELGKSMTLGAKKYGPMNWRKAGVRASVYYDAAQRHLMKWLDGEDRDPESGAHHLAHVMGCCAILMDADNLGMIRDDRPAPGQFPEWTEEHTTPLD